jgi:hypothetical protein
MSRTCQQPRDEFPPAYPKACKAFLLYFFLGPVLGGLFVLPALFSTSLLGLALVLPLALLGLLCILGGLLGCLHAVRSLASRVEILGDGLLVRRLWSCRQYSWEQIVSVEYNGRNGCQDLPTTICSLRLENGRRCRLPHVVALDQLVRGIEEATSDRLLFRALERYRAGEAVDFGRIQLSIWGVQRACVVVPWEEVESVFFDRDGWLTFARKGYDWCQWICVSPNKVHNHLLLGRLLQTVGVPLSRKPERQ